MTSPHRPLNGCVACIDDPTQCNPDSCRGARERQSFGCTDSNMCGCCTTCRIWAGDRVNMEGEAIPVSYLAPPDECPMCNGNLTECGSWCSEWQRAAAADAENERDDECRYCGPGECNCWLYEPDCENTDGCTCPSCMESHVICPVHRTRIALCGCDDFDALSTPDDIEDGLDPDEIEDQGLDDEGSWIEDAPDNDVDFEGLERWNLEQFHDGTDRRRERQAAVQREEAAREYGISPNLLEWAEGESQRAQALADDESVSHYPVPLEDITCSNCGRISTAAVRATHTTHHVTALPRIGEVDPEMAEAWAERLGVPVESVILRYAHENIEMLCHCGSDSHASIEDRSFGNMLNEELERDPMPVPAVGASDDGASGILTRGNTAAIPIQQVNPQPCEDLDQLLAEMGGA